jgi:MinD superfamily P-loop ATPase
MRGAATMTISVASGKGGTGKTMIATSLALAYGASGGRRLSFLDCDVEEPNARIFLKPEISGKEEVTIPVPVVNEDRCTGCGLCAEVCEYHAVMVNKKARKVFVFPQLCHGCGACSLLCPEGAISEGGRVVGVVEWGLADGMDFADGTLRVGEAMSPPLIRALKQRAPRRETTVMDCPPGTSCPVVTSVRGSDFCLLVTEPTPFGLNDLKLAVEMMRMLGIRSGVVINQADLGGAIIQRYCEAEGLHILGEIPHDRKIAENYSRGVPAIRIGKEYGSMFSKLWTAIEAALNS